MNVCLQYNKQLILLYNCYKKLGDIMHVHGFNNFESVRFAPLDCHRFAELVPINPFFLCSDQRGFISQLIESRCAEAFINRAIEVLESEADAELTQLVEETLKTMIEGSIFDDERQHWINLKERYTSRVVNRQQRAGEAAERVNQAIQDVAFREIPANRLPDVQREAEASAEQVSKPIPCYDLTGDDIPENPATYMVRTVPVVQLDG